MSMECRIHELKAPVVLGIIYFFIYILGFIKKLGLGSQSNVKQKKRPNIATVRSTFTIVAGG